MGFLIDITNLIASTAEMSISELTVLCVISLRTLLENCCHLVPVGTSVLKLDGQ